ncbi:hypothetical protein QQ045_004995 [Rhodiola kirilowii]
MATGALRRRLHHGDVDGRRNELLDSSTLDGLSEPLLGSRHESSDPRSEDLWEEEKRKERLHWTSVFSNLLAQWAQWLDVGITKYFAQLKKLILIFVASIVLGSGSFIGRFLPLTSTTLNGQKRLALSPLQEERLRFLKQRLEVPFDGSRVEHQDALKQLWRLAYPDRELPPLKSELWKDMGWQGSDPSTDFRGGGFISLENLIYFAKKYPESFQRLLHKTEGERAEWEYPFAVAGINISFMLAQMLDLQSAIPKTSIGIRFLELLGEDDMAFDNLYCVAFQLMDAQWLAKRASYMEFNDVLKSTSKQLERELDLEDVPSVRDLPAYNLLRS